MWQKEMCEPPCHWVSIQPVEDRIKYRIEEKGKRAYHYHYFKGHYEKDKDSSLRDDTFSPFSKTIFFHWEFPQFCFYGESPLISRAAFCVRTGAGLCISGWNDTRCFYH